MSIFIVIDEVLQFVALSIVSLFFIFVGAAGLFLFISVGCLEG